MKTRLGMATMCKQQFRANEKWCESNLEAAYWEMVSLLLKVGKYNFVV